MNNSSASSQLSSETPRRTIDIVKQGLTKRYKAERRFRYCGLSAIILSLLFLSFLFISIAAKGYTAFQQTFVLIDVFFDPDILSRDALATADYPGLVKKSLGLMFPEISSRQDKRKLYSLVSTGASFQLRKMVLKSPGIIGKTMPVWVSADDEVDMLIKGHVDISTPESERRLTDSQITLINQLREAGKIEKRYNTAFFTSGDSREPELAGVLGALVGSFLTLLITLIL